MEYISKGFECCQQTTYRVVHPKVDVDLRELLPGHELARCAVDGLSCELDCPIMPALRAKIFALYVEESVGLRRLLNRRGHDLNSLDLLI